MFLLRARPLLFLLHVAHFNLRHRPHLRFREQITITSFLLALLTALAAPASAQDYGTRAGYGAGSAPIGSAPLMAGVVCQSPSGIWDDVFPSQIIVGRIAPGHQVATVQVVRTNGQVLPPQSANYQNGQLFIDTPTGQYGWLVVTPASLVGPFSSKTNAGSTRTKVTWSCGSSLIAVSDGGKLASK